MAAHVKQVKPDFPLGAGITLDALSADPYPHYAKLRTHEPVSWIEQLDMWYVTRADMVQQILMDDAVFTTSSPDSTIFDTFGANMLSVDGPDHNRFRKPFQSAFMPAHIRAHLEPAIEDAVANLIAGFKDAPAVELRSAFASRLPIQAILIAFGLPITDEPLLRECYDDFEHALANFVGDPVIRDRAQQSVAKLHAYFQAAIEARRRSGESVSLLGRLVHAPEGQQLNDDEIKRNLSIVFFGGISTVEALTLNAVWALAHHPAIRTRVCEDPALIAKVLDETMRWLSPVQSATRHVVRDIVFHGVALKAGDTINCMLGAANHDPALFPDPTRFDIDRPNLNSQLGFAIGPHTCLGFRLAKTEVNVALRELLKIAPNLRLDEARCAAPDGYEFRQSRCLTMWLD